MRIEKNRVKRLHNLKERFEGGKKEGKKPSLSNPRYNASHRVSASRVCIFKRRKRAEIHIATGIRDMI